MGGCSFAINITFLIVSEKQKNRLPAGRKYVIIYKWSVVLQDGKPPKLHRRWEVVHMSTFECIYLMLTFGTFIIALLAYIDRKNKRK